MNIFSLVIDVPQFSGTGKTAVVHVAALSICHVDTYLVPLTQTMKAEVRKGDRYQYFM